MKRIFFSTLHTSAPLLEVNPKEQVSLIDEIDRSDPDLSLPLELFRFPSIDT